MYECKRNRTVLFITETPMRMIPGLATIRHVAFDLFLRWLWFSYPVPADASDGPLHDMDRHDFRRCHHCQQFQRVVPFRNPAYLCPKCGTLLYKRTNKGCVWTGKIGQFANRTHTFVLAAPLHDPFKSWSVVLVALASIVIGLCTTFSDTVTNAVLLWMDDRSDTWYTYHLIAFTTITTLVGVTCTLIRKRSTEHLFVPAYIALIILAVVIALAYGHLYAQ